ncbi:hypothetical protein [Siphonobacter curvatus]|nr:hypothetical protein [Siphonobacter curvatus]
MKALKQNGSPVAEFDVDDERTYFKATFAMMLTESEQNMARWLAEENQK